MNKVLRIILLLVLAYCSSHLQASSFSRGDRSTCTKVIKEVDKHQGRVAVDNPPRPVVTLSFAQTMDGSIALHGGQSMNISCIQAMTMTHELRALHDCILVGFGTLEADNPQLNVRYGRAAKKKKQGPQPVLLISSSNLKECSSSSSLFKEGLRMHRPIIFTPDVTLFRRSHLGKAIAKEDGAGEGGSYDLIECRGDVNHPGRCDLGDCLQRLKLMGFKRLMVEGGAKVITSFLEQGLVDLAIVTVSPALLNGYKAIQPSSAQRSNKPWMTFSSWQTFRLGTDLIFFAKPARIK